MKKNVTIIGCLICASLSYAQEAKEIATSALTKTQEAVNKVSADTTLAAKTWIMNGSAGLNMSQTAIKNWSAGGENSVAGNAFLNGNLIYKKDKWQWTNTLALEYGLTQAETTGLRKTTDRIDFTSLLGYTRDNVWFYSAMADFKTQFDYGYNYPNVDNYISKFMAPAYSNISLGVEYKPSAMYSLYLSPVAGKLTIVNDDTLAHYKYFGVEEDQHFKAELGAYAKIKFQKLIMENVNLMSDASFFTAYTHNPGRVDVEWNVLVSMKINKYLNASLNTTLKYDDDVHYIGSDGVEHGARIQFKEILGVGIGFNF
jgi:hypothetical protein